MPYAVQLKAELQGITNIVPIDTEENPYQYTFRIECTNCHTEHPNEISFTRFTKVPTTTGKSNVNYIQKCRSCDRQLAIDIEGPPIPYVYNDPPTAQPILKFDTKGCDVLEFVPVKGVFWKGEGTETGTIFNQIDVQDLAGGEFYEYDVKTKQQVSIQDAEFSIENQKQYKKK